MIVVALDEDKTPQTQETRCGKIREMVALFLRKPLALY
jgi:hypothetical protein